MFYIRLAVWKEEEKPNFEHGLGWFIVYEKKIAADNSSTFGVYIILKNLPLKHRVAGLFHTNKVKF